MSRPSGGFGGYGQDSHRAQRAIHGPVIVGPASAIGLNTQIRSSLLQPRSERLKIVGRMSWAGIAPMGCAHPI